MLAPFCTSTWLLVTDCKDFARHRRLGVKHSTNISLSICEPESKAVFYIGLVWILQTSCYFRVDCQRAQDVKGTLFCFFYIILFFQSQLSKSSGCRRHTPRSWRSSWTRESTSGSTADVRWPIKTILADSMTDFKTFLFSPFLALMSDTWLFSGGRHSLWFWPLHEPGVGRLDWVH